MGGCRSRPRAACSPPSHRSCTSLSSTSSAVVPDPALSTEQASVDDLYRRLDDARELAVTRFRQALAMPVINPQSLGEREAAARFQGQRITGLDAAEHGLVIGRLDREAALMAALTAERTGRMTDIVATIQAEQDAIIRSDARGVLVVQGGPGTGKTAVALHRAAYLLYTHRERLSRSGLLVVGPSPTFLRYIADVLPSLGETGVLLAAVRDREELPDGVETVVVDRTKVEFTPEDAKQARARGRAGRRLHNEGRPVFAREVIDTIARRYAHQLGADPLGGAKLFNR